MSLITPALPVIADLHAHTHHSHGQASTEAMYLAAKDKGLKIFGFSEHSPRPTGYLYPTDYQEKLTSRFEQYVDEVRAMAVRGKIDGLTVLLGLEVDYIRGQEAYAADLCRRYPFDYIIGGLHFQGTWGFDSSADDWTPLSKEERFALYARYYDDLASMCATRLFHIAAHPDLIKLFSVDDFNAWLENPAALAKVKEALQAIKDNHMSMEVSSAGLRKPCKEIYPGPNIMALAAAMELPISFASDAHCTDTPGYAFAELARYAAGFGYAESMVPQGGVLRAVPFSAPPAL
jgi:histidinol-phosphatase (PHP family)